MSRFPKPMLFEIKPGVPLLILSCSDQKKLAEKHEWHRFADLYAGPLWRDVRRSGFPLTNIAAISALYGFLEPGMPISTYNRKMDEKISASICGTSNHVPRLADAVDRAGLAFVVGGILYRAVAETAERYRPALTGRITYASGNYLQQRKQLNEWLRDQCRP
jgi:hypothetical protein